ncbi:hypothetical protein U0L13_002919 [Providencia stuartii]|uniref:hypothetical protein n=1 Tax=Providencia stuartii TaxID=588 RepID=UPI001FF2DCB3|nr:hypothetical protein [Providencia stuartii]ELZ5940668.1 hypothetical protein [Providencia stuartii]MCK1144996.1 hypothetical protein [Providencia stuartii]
MPLPQRLAPQKPQKQKIARLKTLLELITHEIQHHQRNECDITVQKHISQWNKIAVRTFEFHEFRDYPSWISEQDFICSALLQSTYIDDLKFDELVMIIDFICSAEGSEAEQGHALELLDINFPNANASDLIYWPDEWFNNEEIDDEFSAEEIACYLCLHSGRILANTPEIALRYPLPK